jgi:hypothetical protein
MGVVGEVNGAGFRKVALVTDGVTDGVASEE